LGFQGVLAVCFVTIWDGMQISTGSTKQPDPEHRNSQAPGVGHVKQAVHASTSARNLMSKEQARHILQHAAVSLWRGLSELAPTQATAGVAVIHVRLIHEHVIALQHVTAASGLVTVCQSESGGKGFLGSVRDGAMSTTS